MKRRIIFYVLIMLINIFLSGCRSSNEVGKLAIATAIGIDKAENGYMITAQIIIPSEISQKYSKGKSPIAVHTATANTIVEAIREMSREVSRKIYLSHIQVLIFGEEIARDGIAKILDFISRNHELRTDFYILVAKDNTANSVLKTLTPIEKISAVHIHDSLEISKNAWGHKGVQLDELIRVLSLEGQELVLSGIVEQGDRKAGEDVKSFDKTSPPDILRLQYFAVFKGAKLIGWLNQDESKGYSYIVGEVENTVEAFNGFGEGKIALEVKSAKSKIKAELYDGIPIINVEIKIKANIGELQVPLDLKNKENIKKIEKTAEDYVNKVCRAAIKKAQSELKSDIFGFGEVIHRGYPKEWKSLKKNWNEKFSDISVNVSVSVEVKQSGTTLEPIFEKEME